MTIPVKIHFQLEHDTDGYPPAGVESVWATAGDAAGHYVIDNTPFFVRDATLGDTVQAREINGVRWFERLVRHSTNSLVRIVFFDHTCIDLVGEQLSKLGCSIEVLRDYNLMSVNIPSETELTHVQELLQREASAGRIDFEEPILRQGHKTE